MTEKPGILVIEARIDEKELARLVDLYILRFTPEVSRQIPFLAGAER